MIRLIKVLSVACLMTTALIFPGVVRAQGDLLITPRRVVFEGSKRSIDLNLANTGQDTAVYNISIIQERMREDGSFETITEPDSGQRFADRFIRYFPRSVRLGPNEAQTVKVQLIRTNELTPGEYRSHFYFRSVPNLKPLGQEEKSKDTTSISVQLIPIFGITIPAIIRVGESDTKVTLTNLSFSMSSDTVPGLTMVFRRSGNMSVYGDLAIDHISPQGKIARVGIANGIAVYTPNTQRSFKLNLYRIPGVDFRSGKLKITFSAPSDVKPAVLAEAELQLH
jgi:hypothetical protein